MDLDDVLPVENFSDLTIQTLADRLSRSRTAEHAIYRESELDELWRLLDIALRTGDPDGLRDARWLGAMRGAVHAAHDLIGHEARFREAADMLRAALRQ